MSYDITTLDALEAIYGTPDPNSMHKVAQSVTPEYAAWIQASHFCVLSSVGPDGTDGSPRGDDRPVVQIYDAHTVLMPDWRGNNRADSLRNIVADGRVSLMFMIPGKNNVIRLNGTAVLTQDPALMERFEGKGRQPRLVIKIAVGEIYSQCARALIRSGLWSGANDAPDVPSMGDILRAQTQGAVDGQAYDSNWAARAKTTMWSQDS